MAILIPSKNIYEVNNQKVRDNVIGKVNVEQNICNIITKKQDVQIKNQEQDTAQIINDAPKFNITQHSITGVNVLLDIAVAGYTTYRLSTFNISIDPLLKNAVIQEILKGDNDIRYTLVGDVLKYKATCYYSLGSLASPSLEIQDIKEGAIISEERNIEFNIPSINSSYNNEDWGTNFEQTSTVSFELPDLDELSPDVKYSKEKIDFTLKVVTYAKGISFTDLYEGTPIIENRLIGNAETIFYNAKYVNFNVGSIQMVLDIEDGNVSYGEEVKTFALGKNELLQDSSIVENLKYEATIKITNVTYKNNIISSYTYDFDIIDGEINKIPGDDSQIFYCNNSVFIPSINVLDKKKGSVIEYSEKFEVGKEYKVFTKHNVLLTQRLAENVLTQYKNGKETAELLCDINDYKYYDSEEVAISISGAKAQREMVFRIHDKVIPMVFGANGQDRPMSNYKDGSPKVFEVVGTEMIYDGAVWQKLTLLEKKQEIT